MKQKQHNVIMYISTLKRLPWSIVSQNLFMIVRTEPKTNLYTIHVTCVVDCTSPFLIFLFVCLFVIIGKLEMVITDKITKLKNEH